TRSKRDWSSDVCSSDLILDFHVGGQESSFVWKVQLYKLRQRGVEELLLGVFDGLSGLDAALKEVFPKADVQRCVVHKLRNTQSKIGRASCRERGKIEKG